MIEFKRHFDTGSLVVITVTFILFVLALITTGFTHDILLEAAIFLVSVKLIVMAYKNIDAADSLHQKLDKIFEKLDAIESHQLKNNDNNI